MIFRAIESDHPLVLEYIAEKEGQNYITDVVFEYEVNGRITVFSPLHFAAAGGKLHIVKWICEQGASVDFVLPKTKYTPLHTAC